MSDEGSIINHYSMVNIPGGTVHLRDDRIKRNWQITVQPFLLSPFPVTAQLYSMMTNHSSLLLTNDLTPVVNVSWYDAVVFCNSLSERAGLTPCYKMCDDGQDVSCNWQSDGYRLPTEAEWQLACKSGTTGYRYGDIDQIAWYQNNSGGCVHEVGGKQANPWGLYDMLGNVWEWCWDVYDEQVYGSYRIFRGGSWAEEERGCGATCRRRSHPTFRIDDLGFRVARSM